MEIVNDSWLATFSGELKTVRNKSDSSHRSRTRSRKGYNCMMGIGANRQPQPVPLPSPFLSHLPSKTHLFLWFFYPVDAETHPRPIVIFPAISTPLTQQYRRLSNICLVNTWMGDRLGISVSDGPLCPLRAFKRAGYSLEYLFRSTISTVQKGNQFPPPRIFMET
jgi:hypothetical protein